MVLVSANQAGRHSLYEVGCARTVSRVVQRSGRATVLTLWQPACHSEVQSPPNGPVPQVVGQLSSFQTLLEVSIPNALFGTCVTDPPCEKLSLMFLPPFLEFSYLSCTVRGLFFLWARFRDMSWSFFSTEDAWMSWHHGLFLAFIQIM